jgi:ribosomal protein S8
MYNISESSHKVFDNIDNEEIHFKISFFSAENIGFLDKELVESKIDEHFKNHLKEHGYVTSYEVYKNNVSTPVYNIDYDNFSAGKAAKIAYLISKSEIQEVTDTIYSAYMEIVEQEINKSASELKMTDIFNLDI